MKMSEVFLYEDLENASELSLICLSDGSESV